MLKNNRWKLKQSLLIAIAGSISVNAYSLPANIEDLIIAAADKAAADWAAMPVEKPYLSSLPQAAALGLMTTPRSPEDIRRQVLQSNYALAATLSDKEFEKSDKRNLPTAPKDAKGNYYLQLGSPVKAVNLPMAGGNFPINLEALYFRSKAAEMNKASRKALLAAGIVAKNRADPVWDLQIDSVTSAYYWQAMEVVGRWQEKTALDHGGDWVGAVAISWGTPASYSMTICGAPTLHYGADIKDIDGIDVGYWSGDFAYGCQAGEIKATASGAWGTVSDSINFL